MKSYKYHVFVCTASGAAEDMLTPADTERGRYCSDKGGDEVRQAFWAAIEQAGIDYVKVTRMGCMVQHKHGPMVVIYPGGVWYKQVQPPDVAEIVQSHLVKHIPVERLVFHRMEE